MIHESVADNCLSLRGLCHIGLEHVRNAIGILDWLIATHDRLHWQSTDTENMPSRPELVDLLSKAHHNLAVNLVRLGRHADARIAEDKAAAARRR